MNKGDLIRQAKITSNIVAKMGKGEDVSMYKKSIKNVHLRWNKNVQLFG